MAETQDKDLVKRTLEGDQHAFGELVERYQGLALGIARKYLRTEELAEDAAQEAFLRAYEALDRLHDPVRFGHWISRIVRNISLNQQRQVPRKTVSLNELDEAGVQLPSVAPVDPTRTELLQRIRDLAHHLPEPYKEVFELRYAGDNSCQWIANFLGLSQGTVTTR
ncbi:TPA: hypothetical protein DDW35_05460, partial [Candidatus Sumerlaeota bacterium]|nr:hypothetical protein [Candidatus Sumerlaeota bacterium]